MSRLLDRPITENDFKQVVFVANALAVFSNAKDLEPPGSKRRVLYAEILKMIRRLEYSIPGYTAKRIDERSIKFYDTINHATWAFMESFKPPKLVGRDAKGRFVKL